MIKTESVNYQSKDYCPLMAVYCTLFPTTFYADCATCEEPKCSYLESIIGEDVAEAISIEDRREILKTLYGPESPFIKLAEKTGIPIRPELTMGNPSFRPSRLSYLKISEEIDGKLVVRDPNPQEVRLHWHNYYRGYYCWKAMGMLQNVAKVMVMSIPQDVKNLIDYYVYHRSMMDNPNYCNSDIDIEKVTSEVNSQDPKEITKVHFVEMMKYLVTNILSKFPMEKEELLSSINEATNKVLEEMTEEV